MADSISMKKLVTRLLLVVVAMFVFGFALVPIYDVMCKAFGTKAKPKTNIATTTSNRRVTSFFIEIESAIARALYAEPCGSGLARDSDMSDTPRRMHRRQASSHKNSYKAEVFHFTSGGVVKV